MDMNSWLLHVSMISMYMYYTYTNPYFFFTASFALLRTLYIHQVKSCFSESSSSSVYVHVSQLHPPEELHFTCMYCSLWLGNMFYVIYVVGIQTSRCEDQIYEY